MSQTNKKIGYLTTIVFIVASTIGAGIFFKNGELFGYAQGNFGLVLASWFVAGFGIMALGLALTEIITAQTTNRGVFEWTSKFVGPTFHKIAINFNKYVYVPMSLFTMPIYFTMTMEDAGMILPNGWMVALVSFAVFAWFMLFNLLSIKVSGYFQWFSTIVKFIPLIVVPIYAFINAGEPGIVGGSGKLDGVAGINGVAPVMVLLAGIPAISFAYDGFQTSTALKEEMIEPNKLGSATVIGIAIITLMYAFVTLGFGLGSTSGSIFGLEPTLKFGTAAFNAMNVFIAIGILGIINGISASFTRQLASQAMIPGEANQVRLVNKLLFKKDPEVSTETQRFLAGWVYAFALTTVFFLIFTLIGIYGYTLNSYTWFDDDGIQQFDYNATNGTLYTLTDSLVNFTSLLFILIIVTAVAGGIKNRASGNVWVEKSKYFLPAAWFSVILFYVSGAWMFIAAFIDSFGFNGADSKASIIKVVILVVIAAVSIIPAIFSKTKPEAHVTEVLEVKIDNSENKLK